MALTYSIAGGADAAKFTIDATSGALSFVTAPDFENPTDANGDNVYEVVVAASDGQATTTQSMQVTVSDVNENMPPQITSPATITVPENSTAIMTVTATDPDAAPPPSSSSIPMAFDDPAFASVVEQGSQSQLSSGQNLSDASWDQPNSDINVICFGKNVVTRVRARSRECIRIAGGGSVTMDQCWLEARGVQPDDHADCIQTFPANTGSIVLKNSYVKGGSSTHCGLFVADGWQGSVTMENVIFHGQRFGARIFSDGGPISVDFKDVFFVGPFDADPCEIRETSQQITIVRWENVREATIVNGELVPGALIPAPSV